MITLVLAFALARQPKIVVTPLPDGNIGKVYSVKIGDGLTGCHVHNRPPAPRDAKYMLPGGLRVSDNGMIDGVPTKWADDYQFDIVCKEMRGRFSISITE